MMRNDLGAEAPIALEASACASDRLTRRRRPRATEWRGRLACALLLASALAPPAQAAEDLSRPPAATPYLTGTCTSCHGTQGRTAGAIPNLAGLPAAYFVEQMKSFREGKRPATIMHQIAKGYSDREADLLADYFARQAPGR